ncbi:MAG: creatininase family protein [Actinomycetota bacterium]|nr:creatininase family protein [Actinomycetota bacterium]
MNSSLEQLSSPSVAALLEEAPIAVIPFGSIEQHGPHLPCGTDTIAAELVARALVELSGGLYAPFCPYGITPLHAGHPGTISLRRQTFEALVEDVCVELVAMGARTIVFVNWHELNTPSLNAVATDLQERTEARFFVAQACYVAERIYAADGGSLTHGGGIEALAVLARDKELLNLAEAGEPTRPAGAAEADEMRRGRDVYGFVTDVTEIAEEGWYGDPQWATEEHAASFAAEVAAAIAERLRSIGALGAGA